MKRERHEEQTVAEIHGERHAVDAIAVRYSAAMIIRQEGLRALRERNDPTRLSADLALRSRRILFRLQ